MPVVFLDPRSTKGGPGSGNFGHAGRPGEIGGSAPDGGGANPSGRGRSVNTKSRAFKKWFGDSQVVTESGDPEVVYHGTTHDITEFAPAGDPHLNPESDWGAATYFTNSSEDVENYSGVGPDLTSRIEQRIEELQGEHEDMSREAAYAQARSELVGGGALSMPVYLSIQAPFVVGASDYQPHIKETYLTQEFEYEDNDPEKDIIGEQGTLVDFAKALRDQSSAFDDTEGVEGFIARLSEEGYDGMSASALDKLYRTDEKIGYITDANGRLASHELYRRALEQAGFDGVIDRTVDQKFGSSSRRGRPMAGVVPDTVHYVVFKPTQIKSAIANTGKFDPNDPRITRAVRHGIVYLDKYSEDQPRDDHGRWSETGAGGGGGATYTAGVRTSAPAHVDARVPAAMHDAEQGIRGAPYETGIAMRPDGTVIGRYSDKATNYVNIPEGVDMRDAVFTHNHPSDVAFSPDDLWMARQHNLAEIRAVTRDGTFRLARTGAEWPASVRDTTLTVDARVRESFLAEIATGQISIDDANQRHWTDVWKRVAAKEPGVVFAFERKAA